MSPTPSPPKAEDCIYCTLSPQEAVDLLRRMITSRTAHTICVGCRKGTAREITDQLNRMSVAPSRKWD